MRERENPCHFITFKARGLTANHLPSDNIIRQHDRNSNKIKILQTGTYNISVSFMTNNVTRECKRLLARSRPEKAMNTTEFVKLVVSNVILADL